VEFNIHGAGNLHGDGMAMWLTKQRAQQGQVFGSIDNFDGLGIFFDTYKNNRPGTVFPYVMAMYGDGQTSYDKNNDGKANEYAGCSARGIRGAQIPTKARLTYFQDKSLTLELQYKAEDQWVVCFEKEDPPAIPSVAYLGFSAETGELSDNHDIISVQTKNLYSPSGRTTSQPTSRNRGKAPNVKQGGSWTWFFIKIVLFCVVVAGGYIGYTAYRTGKMGKRSHRF
jgi:lectin, mannose-binding 2